MENLKQQRDEVRESHRQLLQAHHERFHKVWGQLMKTGYQNSRFAHQLERFACLYTSHVRSASLARRCRLCCIFLEAAFTSACFQIRSLHMVSVSVAAICLSTRQTRHTEHDRT